MTWDQFLKALAKLGLSQTKFARYSDTPLRTVNRWQHRVHGDVPRWVPLWLETYPRAPLPLAGKKSDKARPARRVA